MIIIYMLSGIGGSIISAIFLPSFATVGASGALFGILGSLLAQSIKNWKSIEKPCCTTLSLVISILINLAIGLLPMIDNFDHLGGFFTGVFISFAVLPTVYVVNIHGRTQYISSHWGCKSFIYTAVGLVLFIALFGIGSYILFNRINPNQWCGWCANLNCPQVWSLCKQYSESNGNNS